MGLIKILGSCRETSRRVAQGEFDDAAFIVKIFIFLHLLYCRFCRRYLRELRALARAAQHWAAGLDRPAAVEALERRLIDML